MVWFPSWLWLGSPLKIKLWLANRLMTWTGVLYFWRRWRNHRWFWLWATLVNMVSVAALGILFFWLHRRSV